MIAFFISSKKQPRRSFISFSFKIWRDKCDIWQHYFIKLLLKDAQGISPIDKIAISKIAIPISIAIWKKIADRDRSFAIGDLSGDLFIYW